VKILLVRHGRMAGDPFVCPERPVRGCLSEDVGLPQARALAAALAGVRIDAALSSPYGRALQTAEIALEGRGVPIRVLDCLKEWQPNPELRDAPSTRFEQICARDRERYVEETWKTELGEGCYDMHARVIPPFLAALSDLGIHARFGGYVLSGAARDMTVAVFAHGGSLAVVLGFFLRVPPFPAAAFLFDETGVATLEFTERQGIHYAALRIGVPGGA
jgi:broad specificity phosphatase PhoE